MILKAPAPASESNEPEFEQSRQGEVFEARIHVPGPEHDWSSHAADAFGLMAISYREPSASARFNASLKYPKFGIVRVALRTATRVAQRCATFARCFFNDLDVASCCTVNFVALHDYHLARQGRSGFDPGAGGVSWRTEWARSSSFVLPRERKSPRALKWISRH
jgi:hypothetical protein